MLKKNYMKASRRKDGYIEKPFVKLTDEIKYQYSEESRTEAKKIAPILKSSRTFLKQIVNYLCGNPFMMI